MFSLVHAAARTARAAQQPCAPPRPPAPPSHPVPSRSPTRRAARGPRIASRSRTGRAPQVTEAALAAAALAAAALVTAEPVAAACNPCLRALASAALQFAAAELAGKPAALARNPSANPNRSPHENRCRPTKAIEEMWPARSAAACAAHAAYAMAAQPARIPARPASAPSARPASAPRPGPPPPVTDRLVAPSAGETTSGAPRQGQRWTVTGQRCRRARRADK